MRSGFSGTLIRRGGPGVGKSTLLQYAVAAAPDLRVSGLAGIGQNRQAEFQQAKADHDFTEQELELKTNTQLTREIHQLTTELHRRLIDRRTPQEK